MAIRPATAADAEAICDLHIRSIRVLCAPDYTPEQIEAWAGRKRPELYRQAMTEGGETMLVAISDSDQIAGFAAFKGSEIYGLYVAPASVNQGVGSALLAAVDAQMVAAGVGQVRFRSTFMALGFYLHRGYRPGENAVSRMGGVDIPCVWVTKDLPKP